MMTVSESCSDEHVLVDSCWNWLARHMIFIVILTFMIRYVFLVWRCDDILVATATGDVKDA